MRFSAAWTQSTLHYLLPAVFPPNSAAITFRPRAPDSASPRPASHACYSPPASPPTPPPAPPQKHNTAEREFRVHAANKVWPSAAHGPTHSHDTSSSNGFPTPLHPSPTLRQHVLPPQRDRSTLCSLYGNAQLQHTPPAHDGTPHLGAAAATAVGDAVRRAAALRALVAPLHRAAFAATVRLAEAESVHRCFEAALPLAPAVSRCVPRAPGN